MVIYHPTNSWIVKPEITPLPYGHIMLPNEKDRVSVDAVQSGHATPDPTSSFTPLSGWDSTKELREHCGDAPQTGPVLDLENHYEGAHDNFEVDKMVWNASHVRTGLYSGVYGGATGFTYGCNSVWQMYEPREDVVSDDVYYDALLGQNATGSWRRDVFLEGTTQSQYVTKPLQSLSIATLESLEPSRELLSSPSGHTGKSVNTYESTRYISVLASTSRDRYYVYTGHGDSFSLQLDNGSGARSGRATWMSPGDVQYYASATVKVTGSGNNTYVDFTPPTTGGVDNDWLLVLEF